MKRLRVALAAVGATLAAAGGAAANLSVGVNDDASKDSVVAPWFYSTMQAVGLRLDTLTLLWDETAPSDIAGAGLIDRARAGGHEQRPDRARPLSTPFDGVHRREQVRAVARPGGVRRHVADPAVRGVGRCSCAASRTSTSSSS
jgi:hypothetical protein